MRRSEHMFQFTGLQIAEAAKREAEYHRARVTFWATEQRAAVERAKADGVHMTEYPITGGVRAEMTLNPTLQGRINECTNKIHQHSKRADELQIHAACYGTQASRCYELHPDDVVFWRLAGGPRED